MKKHSILGRTIMCILAVGITAVLAAGCGSKASTASSSTSTSQTAANNTAQDSKQPNGDDMKNQMQSSIDSLVTAGTITKDQGDKIIEALTANRPSKSDSNAQNASKPSSSQGSTSNSGQPPKGDNSLSKLVSDGTITQAQADAVMQSIRKNAPQRNGQNASNTQNSNDQSTTSK